MGDLTMATARFLGRSVLVTGGGSGIGRATALAFAREGALVTLSDIDGDSGNAVVADIVAAGMTARFVHADAADESSVAAMIAEISATFGPLRHAFNNVGYMQPAALETMSRETWDQTLAGSVTSTFLALKHELPVMRANGGGTIVNTASIAGKMFDGSSPAYAVAKAGVVHLTHHASCIAAADNIRVNSVSPGMVATPAIDRMFTPERKAAYLAGRQAIERPVTPEEIAATVLFLSSDEAGMITGIDVEVNGGRRF